MTKMFSALIFAATLAGVGAASAMPLAPLNASDTAAVIEVAQGCGPGYARGPAGRCRPMGMMRRGPAVVVRPPMVMRQGRICPPGLAFRFGRCRPF